MIMFQRNRRSGFVLKPLALRIGSKDLLSNRRQNYFDATIIFARQLPRPKNSSGHEIMDKSVIDPYVQVTIHIPDWPWAPMTAVHENRLLGNCLLLLR
jgi:phosphatidylinositol phospholipase C delta